MFKKLLAVLGVSVMAVLGLQAPALAVAPVQIFDYANGTHSLGEWDVADRPGCQTIGYYERNRTSYIYNATNPRNIRVYVNSASCSGLSAIVYARTAGQMTGQWNNSIDSIYMY